MTLGYDVGPRLTMALGGPTFRDESRRSTHAFAGTFGSAAAAGCIAGLTAQQMRWLLDYASQQAGVMRSGAATPTTSKRVRLRRHAGAQRGDGGVARPLGWNGVDDVFSGDGQLLSGQRPKGNPAVLIDKLGDRYEIVNTDIKKWTVGTPIQAPLDAIEKHPEASARSTPNDVKTRRRPPGPDRRRSRGQP